jgi:urea transporter
VKNKISFFTDSILNSYSIIFFSEKKFFALLLLISSFFDLFSGLCGLVALLTSLIISYSLGFDKTKIQKGLYTFNSLLVGLGIGLEFEFHAIIIVVVVFASILCFFLTIGLENLFMKYYLPFLSLSFLLTFWIVTIAAREFNFIGVSARGIFFMNDVYKIGGEKLLNIYDWYRKFDFIGSVKIYLLSLGAIFFQYNVISGIIIAIGLLYFSRIAFTLSVLGYYFAYAFYLLIGVDINEVSYAYIGFNFILTSIAVGGYFVVPSKSSYLWTIFLMPVAVLLTVGFSSIFSNLKLHIYSLPFNLVVLLFLNVLKSRQIKKDSLTEILLHQDTPENSLYTYVNNNHRFKEYKPFLLRLPFFGEWTVWQAHNGEFTHKDRWRYAWDFVITDDENKTFRNFGVALEDYYCYGKVILAPADGVVEEIVDGIPDNIVGDVNLEHNWGNTIIIKHGDYFYSKMSHLKAGSFRVNKGDWVKSGQPVAECGSSGRSPQPHLHFQLQATNRIDGETIDYPFSQYIVHRKDGFVFQSFSRPVVNEKVCNIEVNNLMRNAFHFVPNRKISFKYTNGKKQTDVNWIVGTDIFNYSYLYEEKSNSYAYFYNDGKVFYFYNFNGKRKSILYEFFLAFYHVPLGFYKNLVINDVFALNLIFSRLKLFIQDFVSPFILFMRANYLLIYKDIDNVLSPSEIHLESKVTNRIFGIKTDEKSFQTIIDRTGINEVKIETKKSKSILKCVQE